MTLEALWEEWRLVHEPLHATVEALGGLAAIVMATFLLQRKREEYGGKLFLLALGFLGMGLLDVFHATTVPGHGFVLLRSMASLVGGFWFALIWLPWWASDRDAAWKRWIPWVVVTGPILFGIWALVAGETLPVMVRNGKFTTTAIVFNLLAGVFFATASGRLLLDFHRFDKPGIYLFACMAALFGLAGLMFPFSALWDNTWWMWHLVRLAAYVLAPVFMVREYQRMVSNLRVTLTERQQAEEALRKAERHLRNVIDGLGPYMFVGLMTTDGTLIEANRPALEIAGLKPEQVLEKPFEETYWWSYSEPVKQQLRGAILRAARGEPSRYDVVVRVGENRFMTVDFSLQPLLDEAGRIVYLIPSGVDITVQGQARCRC